MTGTDDEALWVESTRDPDGEGACLLTWGELQWYAPVAEVRKAALDMVSCAAYAEMTMTLAGSLKLDGQTASALISDLLNGRGVKGFGTPGTVDLLPAGSTRTGDAVVLLRRGGKRGVVAAVTARSMALQWLEAAEATESDQLVSEAMRGAGLGSDRQERVFGYLRELRKEQPW